MSKLVLFEIKKILKRRLSIVCVLAIIVFSALSAISTYVNMYAFDGKSREGKGGEAVAIDMEAAKKYEGYLTDEKVLKILDEYKIKVDTKGLNAAYFYENALQSAVFYRFAAPDGKWNGKKVSDVFGDEKIKIGYIDGWLKTGENMAKMFILLAFVIIVITSPVFAGEKGGADEIILTVTRGRRCVFAKILTGIFTAVFLTALIFALFFLSALVLYGKDAISCSPLLAPAGSAENFVGFDVTVGKMFVYQAFLALASSLSALGLSVFFSGALKSTSAALVCAAALYVLPAVFPFPEGSRFYKAALLLPIYNAQFFSLMREGRIFASLVAPVALGIFAAGSAAAAKLFTKAR